MKNKLAFLPSSVYDVSYTVVDELGNTLAQGTISDEVAAGSSATITIEKGDLASLAADQEAFVLFTARQKEATAWAEAGYVVAEEKLPLQTAKKPMYTPTATDELTVESTTTTITVSGPRFKATFSKSQGTLTGYTYDGVAMMSKPLLLNVFRLPTDNDGNQTGSWDNMGLRKLTVKGKGDSVTKSDDGKTASVTLNSTHTGQNGTAFDVMLNFYVTNDGTLMVNSHPQVRIPTGDARRL